jgi:NADH-quinone oxidoreductase subunit N
MNFTQLIQKLVEDTVGTSPRGSVFDGSLMMFLPELIIVGTILLLLVVRLFNADRWLSGTQVALFGAFVGLMASILQFLEIRGSESMVSREFFTGLLIYDQFTVFFRLFLLLFLVLVVYLTKLSGIPDQEDAPDFYVLLLGSTLGMMLMASANHLLILFLGIEMTSVPSYAMVGFLKGRRQSSEAALKYVVYGAGAAGVMLYGISLLAGLLGTANLPEIAERLAQLAAAQPGLTMRDPAVATLILGILMVLVGLAFKLSLFPFHFWCPDAFEGASAEVAGFLSVASKAAAFALLVRFCLALIGAHAALSAPLAQIFVYLGLGLGAMAATTATFGNLAAYGQTNMKRMLAYSTIAHAGYMLMAVSAMMVILNSTRAQPDPLVREAEAAKAIEALLYYLWVYLFMNLGAFAIVALIRNEIFSEEMTDYAGLAQHAPVLAVCMALCLFSLVGMPPLGGFWGKFLIFMSLFQAGTYHWVMWVVLVIGGLNTVFSLFYYVRVLKYMFISPAAEGQRLFKFPTFSPAGLYLAGISAVVCLMGICIGPWTRTAREVASIFFP